MGKRDGARRWGGNGRWEGEIGKGNEISGGEWEMERGMGDGA